MSNVLLTVEQAAEELKLHPKTVLRHIRSGRLPAQRIGKAYRIERTSLDAFAGVARGHADPAADVRATCVVEIPSVTAARAERVATVLNAAGMTGDAGTSPLHITTAFDPQAESLKVVLIGSPSDVAGLLALVQLQLGARP